MVTSPAGAGNAGHHGHHGRWHLGHLGRRPVHLHTGTDGHDRQPERRTPGGGTGVTITGTNFTGATAVDLGRPTPARTPPSCRRLDHGRCTRRICGYRGRDGDDPRWHLGHLERRPLHLHGGTDGHSRQPERRTPGRRHHGVTIRGTSFTGATAVEFGTGQAGTNVTVVSSSRSRSTRPPESAATVDVTVTTPGGTSATSSADHFTYTAVPTVTAVSPSSGPGAGGTSVTVTGSNLANGTAGQIRDHGRDRHRRRSGIHHRSPRRPARERRTSRSPRPVAPRPPRAPTSSPTYRHRRSQPSARAPDRWLAAPASRSRAPTWRTPQRSSSGPQQGPSSQTQRTPHGDLTPWHGNGRRDSHDAGGGTSAISSVDQFSYPPNMSGATRQAGGFSASPTGITTAALPGSPSPTTASGSGSEHSRLPSIRATRQVVQSRAVPACTTTSSWQLGATSPP